MLSSFPTNRLGSQLPIKRLNLTSKGGKRSKSRGGDSGEQKQKRLGRRTGRQQRGNKGGAEKARGEQKRTQEIHQERGEACCRGERKRFNNFDRSKEPTSNQYKVNKRSCGFRKKLCEIGVKWSFRQKDELVGAVKYGQYRQEMEHDEERECLRYYFEEN